MAPFAGRRRASLDFDRAGAVSMAFVPLALAVVALLLRLFAIDRQPLWFDEAMTLHIVHAPNGLDHVHNTPPLYYVLLRGWCACFGNGIAALRSLSAVVGALTVLASFHAARRAFGERAALATAVFVTFAPIHLYYSQEARAYALLVLVLTVALHAVWSLAAERRRFAWIVLVVANVAALMTHYLAAIPLAIAHLLAALSAPRGERRAAVVAIGSAGLAAVGLLVPWLLFWSSRTAYESRDMEWLTLLWSRMAAWEPFADSFELLLLGGQENRTPVFLKQFTTMSFPEWLRVAALVGCGGFGAVVAARARHATAGWRTTALQCVALVGGSLVVLWLVSFVKAVYCPGRYDLIAFPGLAVLVGGGIALLPTVPRAARTVAAAALLPFGLGIAVKDWRYMTAEAAPDPSRPVAAILAAGAKADETVILGGAVGVPVLAHLYQRGFTWSERRCRTENGDVEFGLRLLPASLEDAPATVARYLRVVADGSLPEELRRLLAETRSAGVWLVIGDELRTGGRDPAMESVGRGLFDVLRGAGYVIVDGGDPSLGVVHLRRRGG